MLHALNSSENFTLLAHYITLQLFEVQLSALLNKIQLLKR